MAASTGAAVADMRLLRSYERERKAAMLLMSLATDGLQQLFARDRECAANAAQLGHARL
jgi:2-polyprenyl-6-methoxyphenol hydroxylase-like FAD-dependent oxidoreductase